MERLLAKYTNSYASYVILFFFYDLAFALFSALISVYLIDRGFSASQVSLLISVASLANMATQPLIGSLTERFGMRTINLVLFAASCGAAGLFVVAPNFAVIVCSYALINLIMNGVNPVVERMATSSPYNYGSIRAWGSIGFAAGTQLSGLIYDVISPRAPYILFIVAMLVALLGFWGTNPRLAETEAAKMEEDAQEPISARDLLGDRRFLHYLVLMFLFSGTTGAAYSFTPAMLTSKGLDASTASTVLSLAALLELPVLLLSARFMDKVPNKVLMLACSGGIVIQMASYAFNLPLPLIIVVTFLLKHPPIICNIMTNMKVVNTIVDPRLQITGLALVKTAQSFGMIVSNNIGGSIVDAAGYPPMFMFLLGLVSVGLVGTIFFPVPSGNDKRLFS